MIKYFQDTLPMQTIIVAVAVLSVYLIFQTQIDPEVLKFTLDTAFTRPPLRVAAVIVTALSLWGIMRVIIAYARHPHWVVWRTVAKQLNWRMIAISALSMFVLILKPDLLGVHVATDGIQIIQAIIPLVIALQMAVIFAPDDEPALEIQLAALRPLSWLIIERLFIVLVVYGVLSSVLSIGVLIFQDTDSNFFMVTVRWLPSALFLGGFGLLMTMQTRLVAFGVIFMAFVWMMFGLLGQFLLQGGAYPFPLNAIQPFLWVFNIFAVPETFALDSDFWLNRVMLFSTGIALMMFAVWQVRDEESMLLNLSQRQRRKAKINHGIASPIAQRLSNMGVTPVDVVINPMAQIWGIGWYEFKMHWRRRALKVFALTLILFNGFIVIVFAQSVATDLPPEAAEMLSQTGSTANGLLLVMIVIGPLATIAIYMFPLLMAEVVPLDKQYHVAETLHALPLNRTTYLIGKIVGMALAGLSVCGIAMLLLAVGWYWRAGAYDPSYFILAIVLTMLLMLGNSIIAILIGSTQPTRIRAIVAVIIFAIGTGILSTSVDTVIIERLLPNQTSIIVILINQAIDALSVSPPQMPTLTLFDPIIRPLWVGVSLQIVLIVALMAGWRTLTKFVKRGDQ